MDAPVIEVAQLSRSFPGKWALYDVSLAVRPGTVLGLVGENGAGKTTLLRHLLGLLRAQTGSVRVFGLDPVKDPPGVLSRVGYLSENRELPDWMTLSELERYTRAFYPRWDDTYAAQVRRMFELDGSTKIKEMSRGQRAKAGLLVALAHRPDLLLLDEPSSGLDPVVRKEILSAIIRSVADESRTVVFSSHLLDEVERVADVVAMLHAAQLILHGPLDEIRDFHRRITLSFDTPRQVVELSGALSCQGEGREWTVLCDGRGESVRAEAAAMGARIVEEAVPTLEEIFVARVKGRMP